MEIDRFCFHLCYYPSSSFVLDCFDCENHGWSCLLGVAGGFDKVASAREVSAPVVVEEPGEEKNMPALADWHIETAKEMSIEKKLLIRNEHLKKIIIYTCPTWG